MRIYYLSATSFFQVDKEVLPDLAKDNTLFYRVVIGKSKSNFSEKELLEYSNLNKIDFSPFHLKYRQRDIRLFSIFYNIIKDIKALNPDVIYIVSFDHPVFSLLSYLLDRKRTVIALHDVVLHSNFNNAAFHNLSRKIAAPHFKNYQVFSESQAVLFAEKYKNKKLFTIPLSLSSYGKVSPASGKDTKVRFLFFGKILPYKGLDTLIAAANRLAKDKVNFELIIAGHGDDWESHYKPLIREARSAVTEHIRYIGNEEIPGLFSSVHYLVLPYRDATQSGPLMIAYNYNTPVIASRIEAFEEYVKEGVTGHLFNANSTDDLSTVMKNAASLTRDQYAALTARMDAYIETNFSRHAVSDKYRQMFADVTNKI